MAASKKQRRVEQNKESSDSENGQGDVESEEEMEIIDVDFDVKVPEEDDKEGIKSLLQQLFLKAHINTLELANLLIGQQSVTNVIQEAEVEEDVMDDESKVNFGVFSIINLTEKKNTECVKQICQYLLDNCRQVCKGNQYEDFRSMLSDPDKHVGLIISERFLNIPPKIAVPLYASLSNDMEKAVQKGEKYDFSYFIIICKIVIFDEGTANENVLYANPEEELIAEVATMSWDFSVSTEKDFGLGGSWTDDDSEGHPKRRVLILPKSKWNEMYEKVVAELGT